MDNSKKNQLLKLRGWGPILLRKIISEVENIISRELNRTDVNHASSRLRDDDIPLSDEN